MNSHFQLGNKDKTFNLDHGFLPNKDPSLLDHTNTSHSSWLRCAADLPKTLETSNIRKTIESLPEFDLDSLTGQSTSETLLRHEQAMVTLSFLAHAYVWCDPSNPATRLPKKIASPWYRVATQLGRPPVLSYASYALCNWKRLDSESPIQLGNICLQQNFLGGLDEEWFILIHVDIEAKAIPALQSLIPLLEAAHTRHIDEAQYHLTQVHKH